MMGPNSRRESNYQEDVTDIFIGLNGVYDNGFDWAAGISTTEYNSMYESSPLTTAVYDWITGADRGDTTDISPYYQWRGDLYYNAAYAFGISSYLNTANYYYSLMNTPAAQNTPCGPGALVDPLFGTTYDLCLAHDRAFSPIPDSAVGAFNAPEVTGAETSSTMIDYQVSGELDVQLPGGPMAFAAVFLVLLRGMWKGFSAARPWLISLISAAIAYLYLPAGWYVPIGAICGIASAFLFIQEDEL